MSKSIITLFDTLSLKKQKKLLAILQDKTHMRIEQEVIEKRQRKKGLGERFDTKSQKSCGEEAPSDEMLTDMRKLLKNMKKKEKKRSEKRVRQSKKLCNENCLRGKNFNRKQKDDVDRDDDEWECEGVDVTWSLRLQDGKEVSDIMKCETIVMGGERYCDEHYCQAPDPVTKEQLDDELDEYHKQTARIREEKVQEKRQQNRYLTEFQ